MKRALPNRSPKQSPVHGQPDPGLPVDTSLFAPGDRICVAVSGGADSTALLRALLEQRAALGIVLSVLHVEHGLRGDASARDAAFVADLAQQSGLPCEVVAVDTPKRVVERKESIEEAARNLRYQVFREVLASGKADKIATAHTLDDQAETVLMKLLRGAWTEGLSGIHPFLPLEGSSNGASPPRAMPGHAVCIRPLLAVRHAQVEEYLRALQQPWCEDETNLSPAYTRNRIRHELLPAMRAYNPQIERLLSHIAANARAEEQHWQAELARILPQILLPGKPVRGGGRKVATHPGAVSLGIEIERLHALDPGLRRRVLRAAAEKCGSTLDFEATERLLHMISLAPAARTIKRLDLPGNVRVERSAREIQWQRLSPDMQHRSACEGSATVEPDSTSSRDGMPVYELPVPGAVEAEAFGVRFTASLDVEDAPHTSVRPASGSLRTALVRAWRPGDRVELAHSRGPKKVKEVLERMGVRGQERTRWPVVLWQGKIVWMRGVQLAEAGPEAGSGASKPRVREIPIGSGE